MLFTYTHTRIHICREIAQQWSNLKCRKPLSTGHRVAGTTKIRRPVNSSVHNLSVPCKKRELEQTTVEQKLEGPGAKKSAIDYNQGRTKCQRLRSNYWQLRNKRKK
jgi:hypothetical protein